MPNIEVLVWGFGIAMLLAGIALVVVLIGTVRQRGKFGINFELPNCPSCGEKVPGVRVPKTVNQFLWGGFTCQCGCEIDKWGKEVRRTEA
jgi:hypothetical protein